MIFVVFIFFKSAHNGTLIDETREIIDMSVSIVSGNSPGKPDDVGHSQIISEVCLHIGFGEARITIGIQHTLFSCQQRSPAVHVNGSSFHHEPWPTERQTQTFTDEVWNSAVL